MTLENPKYKITENLDDIVLNLKQQKRVLINDDGVIIQAINICDTYNFKNILNHSKNKNFTIYCLGINQANNFVDIDLTKDKLIIDLLNCNQVTLNLKSSNLVYNLLNQDYINITIPKNEVLRNLLQKLGTTIIGFNSNLFNDYYYTDINQLLNDYSNTDITILNQNTKITNIENSILKKNDIRNFIFISKGFYDIKLNNILQENNINLSDEITEFNIDKNVYLFNILIDEDDCFGFKNVDNIDNILRSYLSKTILIDFNKKYVKYQNFFGVYVDLSESGDYKEALFNLYNIFVQIKNFKFNLFIRNFLNEDINNNSFINTLQNKIINITKNQIMTMPLQIFT